MELIDADKKQFFKEITENINKWMLEKYPLFDTFLTEKIDKLSLQQEDCEDAYIQAKNYLETEKKKFIEFCKSEVNTFLEEKYPNMANTFHADVSECHATLKRILEKEKKIQLHEEKMRSLIEKFSKSSSLCEDVYKLRDEFKKFSETFEDFRSKMQKLFK